MITPEVSRPGQPRGPMFRRSAQFVRGAQSSEANHIRSHSHLIAVGFGLVATIASWPVSGLAPAPGLDASWEFGLASAAVHHIAWGPHLDFTYGPLGFLDFRTLWFASTATMALAYA